MHKKVVVLTGAGISAENGLKTFRDADGLWEGHDVMEVASPIGFAQNPELVLEFYNQRRRQLLQVAPNAAHLALADLEKTHEVIIITQNVDDLHERAGSSSVLHLHGELLKVRSTKYQNRVMDWRKDLVIGDTDNEGHQLRPHIVWFGEDVPAMGQAVPIVEQAHFLVIIGTSMQVYPAASLINFTSPGTPIYFVDPRPTVSESDFRNMTIMPETAVNGVPKVVKAIKEHVERR